MSLISIPCKTPSLWGTFISYLPQANLNEATKKKKNEVCKGAMWLNQLGYKNVVYIVLKVQYFLPLKTLIFCFINLHFSKSKLKCIVDILVFLWVKSFSFQEINFLGYCINILHPAFVRNFWIRGKKKHRTIFSDQLNPKYIVEEMQYKHE